MNTENMQAAMEAIAECKRTRFSSIKLSGLGLSRLPEELFELTWLEHLYLSHNALTVLDPGLGELTALQCLDLAGNGFSELPDTLANCKNLQTLYLTENALTAFPEFLRHADKLHAVKLVANRLEKLPDWIGDLRCPYLDLSANMLAELPANFWSNTDLVNVDLGQNRLETLPTGDFKSLKKLSDLRINGNRLTALPENIGDLKALQSLVAGGNQIEELPESLANCKRLVWVDIKANRLTRLPDGLFALKKLDRVEVAGNPLCEGLPVGADKAFTYLKRKATGGEIRKLNSWQESVATMKSLLAESGLAVAEGTSEFAEYWSSDAIPEEWWNGDADFQGPRLKTLYKLTLKERVPSPESIADGFSALPTTQMWNFLGDGMLLHEMDSHFVLSFHDLRSEQHDEEYFRGVLAAWVSSEGVAMRLVWDEPEDIDDILRIIGLNKDTADWQEHSVWYGE